MCVLSEGTYVSRLYRIGKRLPARPITLQTIGQHTVTIGSSSFAINHGMPPVLFQVYPQFCSQGTQLFLAQAAEDWTWTPECERSIRELIHCITERPCLAPFSPQQPIVVTTDASEFGIGATLEQNGHPVICISRLLNKAERGYSQTQKEALGVFWAVKRLHKYLFGMRFTIITDHQALQYLLDPGKSVAKSTAAMVQRWSIALAAYDYNIQHRPGKTYHKPTSYPATPVSTNQIKYA
jgi:hypothetical protein